MSTSPQQLRYQLPKKSVKSDCPQCGPKHRETLSRYVDTRTDEPLPEEYGKCDREANCGYHLGPYHKGTSGLSYADAIHQQWVEEQQLQREGDRNAWRITRPTPRLPSVTKPAPVAPVHCLPLEVFSPSLGHYECNSLARFLTDYFGQGVALDLLSKFGIGTSSYWPGACVFWLQDEKSRVRGGQVVLFDERGHTAKRSLPDGTIKRCTSWVHYALASRYKKKNEPCPYWLTTYIDQAEKFPTPFGLHQLAAMDEQQAVAIVESPKTAIIATAFFPQFVWMAIGGLTYLTLERMAPLRMRKLILFPDVSKNGVAFDSWNKRAVELREEGFVVAVSKYLEKRATETEKVAGLDLADYLLDQWKGYPPSWDE